MAGTDTRPRTPAPAKRQPDLPALGLVGGLRWAWRQLTSMRTALFLLMLLAVGAVPGSVFPQRGVDPNRVAQYVADHPSAAPWLGRLGFFDVYASPWFAAIYLLLFVSLVGCVIPRTRHHLASMRAAPPRTPARLHRLPAHRRWEVDADPDAVLEAARAALRRRRYRLNVQDGSVGAERGYLRETGNLVFHIALLGLLGAVAAGSLLSYQGQTIVVQGTGFANVVSQYDSFDPGLWVDEQDLQPFQLTLDDLHVRFETQAGGNQFAAPRDFTADVTVVDAPGDQPRPARIKVNQPLEVDGASVYLQGNGYAPVITVRDAAGNVVQSGPVVFLAQDTFYTSTGVVKVLETQPQVGLQGVLLPTAELRDGKVVSAFPDLIDPRLVFTVWSGDLGLDDGRPQSVYVLDTTKMTQVQTDGGSAFTAILGLGDSVTLPDGYTVTLDRIDRFAALQVRTDPAKGWALAFSVLAITGLGLSLFIARRRAWVQVTPAAGQPPGRIVVQVAALARGDDPRLDAETDALLADIAGAVGLAPPGRDDLDHPDQPVQPKPDPDQPDRDRPDHDRPDPDKEPA